ncbi:hypothetical protein GA0074696_0256 [Micromonospora purpureochromogenes]|uniref:AAA domain-containing protein n=1 Tax=Micromonospora purpureochromogenes TaxID=47872 RepID=A0A1C4UBR4_9ACTN|nr:ATP-binding protein [Micromonospora purpureochromogenes]SCE69106.1 hypothetical protein GA0074696_0256 [Micromonospora purpureochromogenes]
MASSSRRHRRRNPRTCAHECTHIGPELAAARDDAVAALRSELDKLTDPIGTALESLSGEQFASLVWQVPQPGRTDFLTHLGVPPARRPTATAARMGLNKLRHWPKHQRDDAALFITHPVADRLHALWKKNAAGGEQQQEDALREALTHDPSQTNTLRLALICHSPNTWAMTVALRVGLDAALGHPDWPQTAVDDITTVCRRVESVRAQVAAAHAQQPHDNGPHDDNEIGDDETGDEPCGAQADEDAALTTPPSSGTELIPEGPNTVSGETDNLQPVSDGDAAGSGEDLAAAAADLVERQTQARLAAATLTDLLHRGEIPPLGALNPVAAFIQAADRVRDLLSGPDQTIPADATVEYLLTALSVTADLNDQRSRLADFSRLTGPDTERDRIGKAVVLATALQQMPVWGPQQQEHVTGLLSLLGLIDAAAAKDMQALPAAFASVEQHLPDNIAALRMPALGGQLQITGTNSDADGVPAAEDTAPAQDPTPAAAAPEPVREPAVVEGTAATTKALSTTGVPVVQAPPAASTPATVTPPAGEDEPADTAAGRELVRQLLGASRLSLAHHAAAACGDRHRADALRILTLADAVRSETSPTAGALRTALEGEQGGAASGDTAAQMLLLAGTVRACLVTADAGAGRIAKTIAASLHQLPALAMIADAIGTATEKRLLYSPDVLAALAPIAGAANDIAMTVEAAQSEVSRPRNLDFVRASQIADLWWAPNGVIGRILATAAADRRSELETVAEQLRLFAKRQYVDDLLNQEDAHLRSGSSRQLQGQQRRKLKEMVDRSVTAVRAWADAVRANQAAAQGPVPAHLAKLRLDVLVQWPAAEHELQNLITVAADMPWMLQAEAAQACLTSMRGSVGMLDGDKPAGPDRDPDVVVHQGLLRCAALPFTADGVPARPVTVDDVRTAANTSWEDAFTQRIAEEDYATAALIIDAVTDPTQSRAMHDRLAYAAAQTFDELTTLHREVSGDVARATRLGQLDEIASTAMNSALAAADLGRIGGPPQSSNLSEFRSRLMDVRALLPQHLQEAQKALRKRAENEVPAGPDRQQRLTSIYARIDAGDLSTAEEYLLAAVHGEAPPTAEPSDDLTRFLGLTVQVAGGLTRGMVNAIRYGKPQASLGVTNLSAAQRTTADTLQMWLDMRDIRHNKVQKSSLMAALRLAGIEFANMQPLRELSASSRRAWWDLTGVRRIGETPGVPQFSPSAGERQRIMLCWGEPDVRAMFGWIAQDPGTDLPVIVLLFAAMTPDQREELAMMCAQRSEKPVIVIDDIAMLHLALHGSGQFMATARTLLPFAAANPYAPDGLAALPLEMFFGRRSERADIIDPYGANLLYGGRQLGKTALLQEAARAFARVPTNLPIYVTLHNVIGTKVNPLTLWDKLSEKLAEEKILPPKKTRDPIKNVTTAIKAWLGENPTRRMLLLIDECDGFFDADAELGFEHVTHLRNLRDETSRRCKPVFAGLHQVQRFAHLPNQPLAGAHLGEQIAIGPLSPEPAYQLLFTPMEALGIRFASDELIHRILAYCNYQPKLLQLVGKALVSSALSRRDGGPYYLIDEKLLDQVLGSESLQQRVRQTVRLTLDLDSRYKLIALVVAYAALEHGADHTMTTSQLREECQSWWAAGFARQEPAEFRSLLDEMRDLGVLAVTAGTRWRLRSTNVLRLLGSTNEIWEELCSSQWRNTVTKLSTEQARGHLDNGLVSPCTEQQLSRIVSRTTGSTVRVIAGTPATGVDRVRDLLEHSRKGFGARFDLTVPNGPQAYGKALRGGEAGGRHHVVLSQLLAAKPDTVAESIAKAMQVQPTAGTTRTVAVLVDVNTPGILDLLTGSDFAVSNDDVITLRRATDIGLRGWLSDNELMKTFTDATSQAELMTATGGWPLLLDLAAAKAREYTSTHKVCDQVTAYLTAAEGAAEFIEATGLRTDSDAGDSFQGLIDYAGPVTSDELVELCAVTCSDPVRTARILQILDVVDQSDVDGRWTPEPVTAAAWRRLHAPA